MTVRRRLGLLAPALLVTLASALMAAGPTSVADAADDSPSWQATPTGSDEQFRGLDAVSDQVAWVSGEHGGVLRTTDGGESWQDVSPRGRGNLAFRDIEAFDADHAVVLSIGPGELSRVYRTNDGGQTWTQRFRATDPNAFYDCMAFSGSGRGLALSDPVDGRFQLALTTDRGRHWRVWAPRSMPEALPGEFAFAASGTCIVSGQYRNFWFVTGGVDRPRIFSSTDGGRTWSAETIVMRGGPSGGIYSVDFRGRSKGVMVGGAFDDPTNGDEASAYLNYTSGEWFQSLLPVLGYRSGVSFIPHTTNTAIAVGPTGSDVSINGGRAWSNFDDAAYDSISCSPTGCWASGPDGRVARLVWGGTT